MSAKIPKRSAPTLDVALTPAEIARLPQRDLSRTVCVVIDALRATSSIVTALAHGAAAIVPVQTIEEAQALRQKNPDWLLAGERGGLKIAGFDLGNSPREMTSRAVKGKTLVMTTTNGTVALHACARSQSLYAMAFLNLSAVAARVDGKAGVLIVCAGTEKDFSLEDALCAGALLAELQRHRWNWTDAARATLGSYAACAKRLWPAVRTARNAQRLLSIPPLRRDVPFCLRRDVFPIAPQWQNDRLIIRATGSGSG